MIDYAVYVYPAYLVAVIVLAAVLIHALQQRRARRAELAALEAENPRRGHRALS